MVDGEVDLAPSLLSRGVPTPKEKKKRIRQIEKTSEGELIQALTISYQ